MGKNEDKLKFEFEDKTSPHSIIPPLIAHNSYVLDVGCNVGYVGEYLIQRKNCVCDGVDIDPAFLKEAKTRGYKTVFNVDLSCEELKIKQKYDYILLIDILEHLPEPEKVLKSLISRNLREGGKVVVCLPNIARFEYRFSHLLGKFDYETSGILHRGHLRFFTLDSGKRMIKSSGLRINKVLTTGLNVKIKIFPQLTAFQFIYLCEKANAPRQKIYVDYGS